MHKYNQILHVESCKRPYRVVEQSLFWCNISVSANTGFDDEGENNSPQKQSCIGPCRTKLKWSIPVSAHFCQNQTYKICYKYEHMLKITRI